MKLTKSHTGFTIIELMVIIVIIGILGTLVITTYSGVQVKNRNADRQTAIATLQAKLETYYAQYNKYPTLKEVNTTSWQKINFKDVAGKDLHDPSWNKEIADCTTDQQAVFSNRPAKNCYSYQVTTSEGGACDNKENACAQYTLTAQLEGGGKYVKSSLN
jgi:type II secretory pathway pseudopilin PulG